MFADVVGSTRIYDSLGDAQAQQIVAACLDLAKASTAAQNGKTVNELGDEIMVEFSDAGEAAAAACDIHAKMAQHNAAENGPFDLRMRIGLHCGPIEGSQSDMAGETAKIAHWAAGNAKPEQTLATAAVIDNLPRIYQAVSRFVDDETWNFISIEHMAVHEIIWDVESVTAYSGEIPTLNSQKCARMIFSWNGKNITLDAERPVISIGRGSENDLIVNHDMASRQHLSAQFSRGRCTITDNSTNGTTIYTDGDRGTHEIKRESFTVLGSGRILLGRPEDVEEKFAVVFRAQ